LDATPAQPGLVNWLILLALGAVWGSAFMAMEIALTGFGPWWVAALRTSMGAPVLLAAAQLSGQGIGQVSKAGAWGYVAPVGVIGMALPFFLLSWGQQHVPSAFAGVAMASLPIVLVPLAFIFLRDEVITPVRILGLLVGFGGLVLLIGPGAFEAGAGDMTLLGRLSCLSAVVCYSAASIITRHSPKVPPLAFSAGILTVASAVLLPVALILEGVPRGFSAGAAMAAVYAALFPTALAAYWRVRVIKSAGSVFMSLVAYIIPVFSVLFGVLLLGEELQPGLYAALALILTGIAISQSSSIIGLFWRRG
jgi:drug/metabolite transporter (DMT)-like permease